MYRRFCVHMYSRVCLCTHVQHFLHLCALCRVRISRRLAVVPMLIHFFVRNFSNYSYLKYPRSQCFFPLITIKIQCPCKNGLQQQKCKFAPSVLICNWPSYFPYPYTLVQWDSAAISQPCLPACFPPCLVDKRG